MGYPDCPQGRTDCRFSSGGGLSTCMSSPIQYDRSGAPVSGGANTTSWRLHCSTCHSSWSEIRTDLERAQGKAPEWTPNP